MKCVSKLFGLLLIAAVAIAPLATNALAEPDNAAAPLTSPAERSAGCHMHGGDSPLPHSPRPVPANYQCCLTGHDAAAVQISYSPQPSTECTRVTVPIEPAMTLRLLSGLEVSIALSADPPGATPLRI
jgi:hypothetical protein